MFGLEVSGDWKKTFKFLKKLESCDFQKSLEKIAIDGTVALQKAAPKDSGLMARSWDYTIDYLPVPTITWHNYDIEGGYNVAVLIEYGHGLRQGGYVPGKGFINPALSPVFNSAVDILWKEVNSL